MKTIVGKRDGLRAYTLIYTTDFLINFSCYGVSLSFLNLVEAILVTIFERRRCLYFGLGRYPVASTSIYLCHRFKVYGIFLNTLKVLIPSSVVYINAVWQNRMDVIANCGYTNPNVYLNLSIYFFEVSSVFFVNTSLIYFYTPVSE